MHITSDNFMLLPGLIFAAGACVLYLIMAFSSDSESREPMARSARILYYISLGCVAYSAMYLLQQLLSGHRYDISYVFYNSGPKDALLYKISALWAGQEGSLLLWALLSGLIGLAFLRFGGKRAPLHMAFWCLVQVFFLVILVVEDPFSPYTDFLPGVTGGGLNPLLKNPWMAVHPPVIFLGYALLTVPAAFALQALFNRDGADWVRKSLPWALMGWVAMTGGLVLGMIWSYQVLGWGGYWGWDPVENASLVPWLLGTALVHGLVLQRYRGLMARANLGLAFATFLTVIYATFITRSGLLSEAVSVHAFADSKSFVWLRGFSILFGVICAALAVAAYFVIPQAKKAIGAFSRDFSMAAGVIVVGLFSAFVLAGVTATTFAKVPLKPSFYNDMATVPAIAILGLIGLAPLVKWNRESKPKGLSRGLFNAFAVVVLLSLCDAMFAGFVQMGASRHGGYISPALSKTLAFIQIGLLVGCAIFALAVSIRACLRSSLVRSGAYIAHMGAAILVIGILVSANSPSQTVSLLRDGGSRRVLGYDMAYKGVEHLDGGRYAMVIEASRNGRTFTAPITFEDSSHGLVRKPFVRTTLAGDLYLSGDPKTVVLVPTISVMDDKVVAGPAPIPGTNASLDVVGIAAESRMIKMQYVVPGRAPVEFTIDEQNGAEIDGYQIAFQDFVHDGGDRTAMNSIGVKVWVTGQKVVVNVSTKPLIYLVWIGSILIMLGGSIAVIRRWRERGKPGDGLLPDSAGSDE